MVRLVRGHRVKVKFEEDSDIENWRKSVKWCLDYCEPGEFWFATIWRRPSYYKHLKVGLECYYDRSDNYLLKRFGLFMIPDSVPDRYQFISFLDRNKALQFKLLFG